MDAQQPELGSDRAISTALAYFLYFRILSTAGATNLLLVTPCQRDHPWCLVSQRKPVTQAHSWHDPDRRWTSRD
jgi:hypothetical protein